MRIRLEGVTGQLDGTPAFLALTEHGLFDGLRMIPELGLQTSSDLVVTVGSLVMGGADAKPEVTAWIEDLPAGCPVPTADVVVTEIADRLRQLGLKTVTVRWKGQPR